MQFHEHVALREACAVGYVGRIATVVVVETEQLLVGFRKGCNGCFHLLESGFMLFGVRRFSGDTTEHTARKVIERAGAPSVLFVKELESRVCCNGREPWTKLCAAPDIKILVGTDEGLLCHLRSTFLTTHNTQSLREYYPRVAVDNLREGLLVAVLRYLICEFSVCHHI